MKKEKIRMAKSLQTEFVKYYKEKLEPYGFKKVKGRQPYFVRVVNDEILHIISFYGQKDLNYQTFMVSFGVATVYRKEIALEESTRYTGEWLSELWHISQNGKGFDEYEGVIPYRFEYVAGDENAMQDKIVQSFEYTEEMAISILDDVTTLEECVKYFFKYKPGLMRIDADDRYIINWLGGSHNEGLLATMVYGKERFEEYVKIRENRFEEFSKLELEWIHNGKSGLTLEEHRLCEIDRRKQMQEMINAFEVLVSEPEWKAKVSNELELRKKNNIELLKKFGIEIG